MYFGRDWTRVLAWFFLTSVLGAGSAQARCVLCPANHDCVIHESDCSWFNLGAGDLCRDLDVVKLQITYTYAAKAGTTAPTAQAFFIFDDKAYPLASQAVQSEFDAWEASQLTNALGRAMMKDGGSLDNMKVDIAEMPKLLGHAQRSGGNVSVSRAKNALTQLNCPPKTACPRSQD